MFDVQLNPPWPHIMHCPQKGWTGISTHRRHGRFAPEKDTIVLMSFFPTLPCSSSTIVKTTMPLAALRLLLRNLGSLKNDTKKTFKPSNAKAARDFFHNMAHGDASRLSRISYAITNHAPTGEYRLRFFPEQPAHCPHCGEDTLLSRRHILCECPRYVSRFPSLADWGSQRHNDKALSRFLDKNPTAFSFGELPRDVH